MKKVLSLVLVAVLAIGMAVTGFAYDPNLNYDNLTLENIKDFADGKTLADGVDTTYATVDVSRRVANMGTVHPKDKPKFVIDLWSSMFGDVEYVDVTNNTVYVVDVDAMHAKGALTTNTSINSWVDIQTNIGAGYELFDVYEFARKEASKYANARNAATAFLTMYRNAGFVTTAVGNATSAPNLAFRTQLDSADFVANSTFFTAGSDTQSWNRRLTSTEIQKSRLQVNHTVTGDSNLIKSLEIVRADGQIVMKPLSQWTSVDDKDVEVNIYLTIDGRRLDEKGVRVLFNLKNPVTPVYASHNYVDLSEGYVAEAVEFNSAIQVYLGEGVSIYTKFFKDKKYYGIATRDDDEEDERVFRQYKDIDNVLTLKTIGLNNAGDYIRLNTDYSGYFVYDKDMNYLGKGDEDLKFSSKLYLSYNKLEIEEDEDEAYEDEAPVPSTPDNPITGGTGEAANNPNMNPGTGR